MAEKLDNEEKRTNTIARSILSLFGLVFLGFIFFGDRSNCGVDQETLACRWTGSLADIIGTIIVLAGVVWMSGLADRIVRNVYDYGDRNAGLRNALYGVIGTVIGFVLIYW